MSDQDRETPQAATSTTTATATTTPTITTTERETARETIREAIKDDKGKQPEAAIAPPPFEPLFTLLTNKTTNATVHPRVHYLFSDDDDASSSSMLAAAQGSRAVIVDLAAAPDGRWGVAWAASLSADFAVTGSQLAAQQSHGDADGDGGPLMLRVEGVEREPVAADERDARDVLPESVVAATDVEGLAEEFRRRMGVLRRVVGETERRRAACDEQQQQQQQQQQDDGGNDNTNAAGGEA